MKTVCVECRWQQDVSPTLDAIAEAFSTLGYRVLRWTHDKAQGSYGHIAPVPCDVAVTWHGFHPCQNRQVSALRRFGARLLFVEYAWWDRGEAFQMDPCGNNGGASWARWPGMVWKGKTLRPVTDGPLLLCLQGEYDATAKRISPWFQSNADLITFVTTYSKVPVVVRPHPYTRLALKTKQAMRRAKVRIDNAKQPIEQAIAECSAVATLSSQCGVLAMEMGKPVLVYGKAAYRCPGAVYCLDDTPAKTVTTTEILAAGSHNLSPRRQKKVLSVLRRHTLYRRDLPGCLEPLLKEGL